MKTGDILRSFLGLGSSSSGGRTDFTFLFSSFREVLSSHNRAVEKIADMADKLGGDYIFDINYIRPSYEQLRQTVSDAVKRFDAFTDSAHPQLAAAFYRIDNEIVRLVHDAPPASAALVVDLGDISWDMERVVGGKSLHLAEVKNGAGLSVPSGFSATAKACSDFMRYNRLDEAIAQLRSRGATDEENLAALRGMIMQGEFPPPLSDALAAGLSRLSKGCGRPCFLAVRSSAVGEDGEFSFAGQFTSVLQAPAEIDSLKHAYKQVIAGIFTRKAAAYLQRLGLEPWDVRMPVCCLLMVDARSSGVVYTSDPSGQADELVISSAWGLGGPVVEGAVETDHIFVRKAAVPRVVSRRIGIKSSMEKGVSSGGIETVDTPAGTADQPSLEDDEIIRLARQAMTLETYFRRPLDIEWAIDQKGRPFILQARPLKTGKNGEKKKTAAAVLPGINVLMKDKGSVVQRGTAAGKVFLAKGPDGLDLFPRGAVLVARHDSSEFIRVMPYVSAIITDTGSPASHMAALCREFRVPTVINAGDATRLLAPGMEVTVVAGEDGSVSVYEGIERELLEQPSGVSMEDLYEFRRQRYLLRYISPLFLIDPLTDDFRPERCRTLHDILRFIHEKAVMRLVERARSASRRQRAAQLELPVPAGIMAVDMGGGLDIGEGRKKASIGEVASVPLRAVLEGMTHPGVWHADMVSLTAHDFVGSMMRMPDIFSDAEKFTENNFAVITKEYMSLSLRFGYHFTVIDCYCSDRMRNNHLYFRFGGGATDMAKRSRRVDLISFILKEFGFTVMIKGDLITARLANVTMEDMKRILDQMGRLLAYTRQLDAVLHDDSRAELYARRFLKGDYSL
ncbi:MAG: PEP-utilizing enzyme [Nitrospiraceae bacterium]|nr:PEP-utilizing enzyme [Nitrospiraceae bacterium]